MRNYKESQELVLSGDARAEQLVFLVYLISDNKKSCISFEIQLGVRREGFEPPTPWFVAMYSIQLSYRRI